jgi:hypothetical protein
MVSIATAAIHTNHQTKGGAWKDSLMKCKKVFLFFAMGLHRKNNGWTN